MHKNNSQSQRPKPELPAREPAPAEPQIFSDAAIQNIVNFAHILRRIHARLHAEGYTINNGKIVKRKRKAS